MLQKRVLVLELAYAIMVGFQFPRLTSGQAISFGVSLYVYQRREF
jgi:hypothetical protein